MAEQQTRRPTKKKQVVTNTLSANAHGVMKPGTVVTLAEAEADDRLRRGLCREYDQTRDAKAPRHREQPPARFE